MGSYSSFFLYFFLLFVYWNIGHFHTNVACSICKWDGLTCGRKLRLHCRRSTHMSWWFSCPELPVVSFVKVIWRKISVCSYSSCGFVLLVTENLDWSVAGVMLELMPILAGWGVYKMWSACIHNCPLHLLFQTGLLAGSKCRVHRVRPIHFMYHFRWERARKFQMNMCAETFPWHFRRYPYVVFRITWIVTVVAL